MLTILLSSCSYLQPFEPPRTHSSDKDPLLKPIKLSEEAVGLEIYFIRRSVGNQDSAQAIWDNVSDLSFPESVRRQMRTNGFRFGVLASGQVSKLIELLNLIDPKSGAKVDAWSEMVQFTNDDNIMCRYVEMLPDQPTEALASDVYDELTILQNSGGNIGGQTFTNAQCVFRITSSLRPDGAVDLTVLPELQYGDSRQQYSFEQGVVKMEYGRNRKTLDKLQLKAKLKPGEMVVLSCLPNQAASLGANFFTDASIKGDYQKLMVLRLVRCQHDGLFPENGVKQTDCINKAIVNGKTPLVVEPIVLEKSQPNDDKPEDKAENKSESGQDKSAETENKPESSEMSEDESAEPGNKPQEKSEITEEDSNDSHVEGNRTDSSPDLFYPTK